MTYEERNCDICTNNDLHSVWSYSKTSTIRAGNVNWQVNNVICKECGFAFVSPAPTEKSLASYYGESYHYTTLSTSGIDYSIEKRLAVLEKYGMNTKTNIIEVGGNNICEFQKKVSTISNSYINVEINNSCDNTISSLESLADGSVDIIASYFVLEHITKPNHFFSSCKNKLVEEGILIIEVPNLYNYYRKPEGLHFYEHVNHFSPRTLSNLAFLNGFKLLEISNYYCSRDFGFVAIYKKELFSSKAISFSDPIEYTIAKTSIEEGKKLYDNYEKRIEEVKTKIKLSIQNHKKVLIWVANDITIDILEDCELSENVKIVDSNHEKKSFLKNIYDSEVFVPSAVKDYIKNSNLIIINSPMHASSILEILKQDYYVDFDKTEIIITIDKYN